MPRNRDVDAWFERYENPMKDVVARMREIVLGADPRIDECIKWQAPTFVFEGNLASFFPKSKQHASLMFHQGAKIPGTFARLEGDGATGRVMKIGSVTEANQAKAELEKIVRAWCEWRAGDAKTKPVKAKAAKAKRAKAKSSTTTKRAKAKSSTKPKRRQARAGVARGTPGRHRTARIARSLERLGR